VRTRICEPLGLRDTWVEIPESERRRVANGHARRGREARPWHLATLAGAGGLRSTAADLLAFLGLHAATSESPLAAAAAETARPRSARGRIEIGLGWLIVPPGRRLPWRRTRYKLLLHEGGTGGFRSFAGVVPEIDAAVVVLPTSPAQSAGSACGSLTSSSPRCPRIDRVVEVAGSTPPRSSSPAKAGSAGQSSRSAGASTASGAHDRRLPAIHGPLADRVRGAQAARWRGVVGDRPNRHAEGDEGASGPASR